MMAVTSLSPLLDLNGFFIPNLSKLKLGRVKKKEMMQKIVSVILKAIRMKNIG